MGNDEGVVRAVEEFERSGGFSADRWRIEPGRRGRILEIQFWSLVPLGRRDETVGAVERASRGLTEALTVGPRSRGLAQAHQLVDILSANAALLRDGPGAVELTRQVWENDSLHLKAVAVQAEAWAHGDRQREALSLARFVDSAIGSLRHSGALGHVLTPEQCADVETTLIRARLLAGEWHDAGEAARRLAGGAYPVPHAIAFGTLISGLLSALADRPDEALDSLLPAAHQLAASGGGPMLDAAVAAAEFCLTREDVRLPSSPRASVAPGTFVGWSAEIFRALGIARDDPRGAAARLSDVAERCRTAGASALEMATLGAALRVGDMSVAGRLAELASVSQTPAAVGYALVARGVLAEDPVLLADGLAALISRGQLFCSHGDGSALMAKLGHRERRRLLGDQVRARSQAGPAEPAVLRQWHAHLTKREVEIAEQAIAGLTNAVIARTNGVSVRTVEGHLYQVYSKLHVRNRQELAAIARTHRER